MQNLYKIGHGHTSVSVLFLKRIYFTIFLSHTTIFIMACILYYICAYGHFRVIKWPAPAAPNRVHVIGQESTRTHSHTRRKQLSHLNI